MAKRGKPPLGGREQRADSSSASSSQPFAREPRRPPGSWAAILGSILATVAAASTITSCNSKASVVVVSLSKTAAITDGAASVAVAFDKDGKTGSATIPAPLPAAGTSADFGFTIDSQPPIVVHLTLVSGTGVTLDSCDTIWTGQKVRWVAGEGPGTCGTSIDAGTTVRDAGPDATDGGLGGSTASGGAGGLTSAGGAGGGVGGSVVVGSGGQSAGGAPGTGGVSTGGVGGAGGGASGGRGGGPVASGGVSTGGVGTGGVSTGGVSTGGVGTGGVGTGGVGTGGVGTGGVGTGGVGGGAGAGGAPPGSCIDDSTALCTCTDYCSELVEKCPGRNYFPDGDSDCVATCMSFNWGQAVLTSIANPLSCRTKQSSQGTVVSCVSASPPGGRMCGDYCSNFCTLVSQNCPGQLSPFTSNDDCMTYCSGTVPQNPGKLPNERLTSTGDTYNCRLYWAAQAGRGAAGQTAACANAGPNSSTCRQ